MNASKQKAVNIISFDIPYPPDYGGVIDVFHQVECLSNAGVKVVLHCFQYRDRQQDGKLEELCEEVYYYKRYTSIWRQMSYLPYSVWSRENETLIANLLKNDYPIVFEGLVSCFYLTDERLALRKKIYREVNIEHQYYWHLAKASRKWIEKLYFFVEGCKLYFYQKNVKHAQSVWSVASDDADYMRRHFPNVPVVHLPCFHSHDELMIMPGKSDYVLYHGNLALAENESAALFLIKEVFPRLPYRCVVAGRRPNPVLYQAASQVDNVEIMANPSQEEMDLLVKEAHIHLLYTAQPTGLKLKLLNVLYQGRHIVANSHMLAGTDLLNSRVCHVAETAEQLVQQCLALKNTAVGNEHIATRAKFLQSTYSRLRMTQEMLNDL